MIIRTDAAVQRTAASKGAEIVYLRATNIASANDLNDRGFKLDTAPVLVPQRAPARTETNSAAIHFPKSRELTIWGLCGAAFMSLALAWAL